MTAVGPTGTSTTTATARVVVANVAPKITALSAPPLATVGEVTTLSANWADEGIKDTQSCMIDWGDGNFESSAAPAGGSGTCASNGTHRYAATGIYTVTMVVADKDGDRDIRTTTIQVMRVKEFKGEGNFVVAGTTFRYLIEAKPGCGKVGVWRSGVHVFQASSGSNTITLPTQHCAGTGTWTANGVSPGVNCSYRISATDADVAGFAASEQVAIRVECGATVVLDTNGPVPASALPTAKPGDGAPNRFALAP